MILLLGWRLSLISIGGVSFLLAILAWFVIRNHPEDKGWQIKINQNPAALTPEDDPKDLTTRGRLGIVFRKRGFWMITASTFFFGGPALTFQGLWAVPYLMDVYGYSRMQAGGLLMLLPLSRKFILQWTLGLGLVCWIVLVITGGRPDSVFLAPLFMVMGACGGGSLPLFMTITKELFPPSITGTAVGLMNTAAFLSTAVYQPFSGFLMDTVGRSVLFLHDYRFDMYPCAKITK
jgi:sugar phosphate permease